MTEPKQLTAEYMEYIRAMDTITLQQLLSTIKQELYIRPDFGFLCDIWHLEDIKGQRPDLTDDQCRAVLRALERNHNAEIGINWDVIDAVADDLYPPQKTGK